MQVDLLLKHEYYPIAIYEVSVNISRFAIWDKGKRKMGNLNLLTLIAPKCSNGHLCGPVAVILKRHNENPSCGYAALVGNLRRFCEVSHIERVTHLISSCSPSHFHGISAHFLSHTKTPHARYGQFYIWSVMWLSLMPELTAWKRAQEVVHCRVP